MQKEQPLLLLDAVARQATQDKNAEPLRRFIADLIAPEDPPADERERKNPVTGKNKTSSRFMKVEQTKIDQLIDLIAEMAVAKNGLLHISQQLQSQQNSPAIRKILRWMCG